MNTPRPYTDKGSIRTFSEDTNEGDLVWHRDHDDRIIKVLEGNDWFLQFDNELPVKLIKNNSYLIKEGIYHRIIKGTNNLKISIRIL